MDKAYWVEGAEEKIWEKNSTLDAMLGNLDFFLYGMDFQ